MRKFEDFNPLILFIYYMSAIIPFMVFMDPLLSAAALAAGLLRAGIGKRRIPAGQVFFSVALTAVMTIMNGLTSHQGNVELLFINGRAITLEALQYGAVTGLMMSAAIVWFGEFSQTLTGEKVMIMLRRLPKTALMISMVIRLIPRYIRRYRDTQIAMRVNERACDTAKTAGMLKISSAVFTWALENSMDTADVMIMRGYGNGAYRRAGKAVTKRDVMLAVLIVLMQLMWIIPHEYRIYAQTIYFIIPEIYLLKENLKWKIYTLRTSDIKKY